MELFEALLITGNGFLPPVPAAEAGDAACDDHHEAHADGAHDQQQLEVDLAVLAREPGVAVAADLLTVQHALPVPVAELALGARPGAQPARQLAGRGDVQVA